MSKKHWIALPSSDKIRIHLNWIGVVLISFEPKSHPNQIHELKGIVPQGTVYGVEYFQYLQKKSLVKDYVQSPHEFFFQGQQLRIDAVMGEYALLGFVPLPGWLVQSVIVTLWVDGTRYWEGVL